MYVWYKANTQEIVVTADCDPIEDKNCCDITKDDDCGISTAEKDSWGEVAWNLEFF